MFVPKKTNRSGSISVVVVAKKFGKVHYLKTIGVSRDAKEPVRCRIVEVRRYERTKGRRTRMRNH